RPLRLAHPCATHTSSRSRHKEEVRVRSEAPARAAETESSLQTHPCASQILDTLEQAVVALDRERRVVYNNRRFEELLGAESGTLVGQPGSRLFPRADARWLQGGSRAAR